MKIGVEGIKSESITDNIPNDKMSISLKSMEKNIKMASVSSKILQSLTEDILDFAKIEAGMFSLNEHPFVIQNLIEEIKYIFEFQ